MLPYADVPVDICFKAERDLADWTHRHEVGEVPSRWPYGLDQVAISSAGSRAISVGEPGRFRGWRRLFPGHTAYGVALAWEEVIARRMLLTAPHTIMVSGVIWATDQAVRGESKVVSRAVRTLRRMTALFVLSSAQQQPLQDLVGPGGPSVDVVRFGVDTEFFTPSPPPEEPRLVLSLGADRDRDHTTLLRAFEYIHQARPHVRLVVQTDRPVPDGVEVLPSIDHLAVRDLYRAASVVVVATRENLHVSGMTVGLETMACERPLVITQTPGMADYFTDDRNALLAPVGDPGELADRIVKLLDDPDLSGRLSRIGRADVVQSYSTVAMAEQISSLIQSVAQ